MTLSIERPAVAPDDDDNFDSTTDFSQCPPWCKHDPDWHYRDLSRPTHTGLSTDFPTTAQPPFGAHWMPRADNLHVTAAAHTGEEPVVWLIPSHGEIPVAEGVFATLDQAEDLAWHLLGMVSTLRDGDVQ